MIPDQVEYGLLKDGLGVEIATGKPRGIIKVSRVEVVGEVREVAVSGIHGSVSGERVDDG